MSAEFDTEGKTSIQDFNMAGFEKFLRNKIAWVLEKEAVDAIKSNEYNFNDTAIRSKTLFYAAQLVRDSQ